MSAREVVPLFPSQRIPNAGINAARFYLGRRWQLQKDHPEWLAAHSNLLLESRHKPLRGLFYKLKSGNQIIGYLAGTAHCRISLDPGDIYRQAVIQEVFQMVQEGRPLLVGNSLKDYLKTKKVKGSLEKRCKRLEIAYIFEALPLDMVQALNESRTLYVEADITDERLRAEFIKKSQAFDKPRVESILFNEMDKVSLNLISLLQEGVPGLDFAITILARNLKKEVRSLESTAEQLDSVLTEEEFLKTNPQHPYVVNALELQIDAFDAVQFGNESSVTFMRKETPQPIQKKYDERDRNMTIKIVNAIREGRSPFVIALGAMHLVGDNGIVSRLRKLGFEVTSLRNEVFPALLPSLQERHSVMPLEEPLVKVTINLFPLPDNGLFASVVIAPSL